MEEEILKNLYRQHLIQTGDKILIGVSGGADSIALLLILNQLKTTIGFQIHVGHINHHLRKSALADQRFVEKVCTSLNLACTCIDLDLKKTIKQGGSVEEIARKERLKALGQIAKKIRAHAVALAHHNDDLAETVLMRILRGTGLQGLQAILPYRNINGTVFIRPLLDVSRAQIEGYLKKNKIKFRSDPTNTQTRFFRNKIRLKLLPLLEKDYQKNIKHILSHLALTSAEDYDYLRQQALAIFPKITQQTKKTISITLTKFKILPIALQRMILRLAIEKIKSHTRTLTWSHYNELADLITRRPTDSIVDLPSGLRASKTKTALILF
jgi:tRNA(Ile)-lysidine synthase